MVKPSGFGNTAGFPGIGRGCQRYLGGANLVQKIAELINPFTGGWDVQLVERTLILALPVHLDLNYCVVWHYDKKGVFSVRLAYKMLVEEQRRDSIRGVQGSSAGSNMQAEH